MQRSLVCALVVAIRERHYGARDRSAGHSRRRRKGAAAVGSTRRPKPDDNAGFVPIFDGKTLNGWDGDPRYWRVENGEIVGETTPEKVVTAEQLPHLARRHGQGLRAEGRVPA